VFPVDLCEPIRNANASQPIKGRPGCKSANQRLESGQILAGVDELITANSSQLAGILISAVKYLGDQENAGLKMKQNICYAISGLQ
jgi:hypothetical protein